MRYFCFTVDVDRDANVRLSDRIEAGSASRGDGFEPRFTSTKLGLAHLVDILDEMNLKATFFLEGRTLEEIRDSAGLLDGFEIGTHSYDHEFFPAMLRPDAQAAVMHSVEVIKDIMGRSPDCFRAPYMKQPKNVADFLRGTGIRIDSSSYANVYECQPRLLPGYIVEIPVAEGCDFIGRKINSYMWTVHESKRSPLDLVDLADLVPEEGTYVLGDHSWHMVEDCNGKLFSEEEKEVNLEKTARTLEAVMDLGFESSTLREASARAV